MSDFDDKDFPDEMTQMQNFETDGVVEKSQDINLTAKIEKEVLDELDNFDENDISDSELLVDDIPENTEIKELQEKITSLESKLAFETDQKLRIAAEFENFRKRSGKTSELGIFRAQSDLLDSFIPVLDHLEMAMDHAQKSANIESLLNGIEMVMKQFRTALEKWNVLPVDALGKRFDPNVHEAMAQEESNLYESGIVISQWQKGYILGERLIRPARVVVSKGPGPAVTKEKSDDVPSETPGEE
ncbi:MAG: nucleotide exchange factor GrpE [Deltaproteobacteria bacterium]|nr:nucleotide exchange factor GrpE [Deltaproteobacteria bacterium]